jgi:hypothetical protein
MLSKEKNNGVLLTTVHSFRSLKELTGMFFTIVFLLISICGFASGQNGENVYTSGNTTIVYSVNSSNAVMITEGNITAMEGKTIRLLPGTHIKSSEQLTVNIASKEYQVAVAREIAVAKEEKMLTTAAKQREEALPQNETTKIPIDFNYRPIPGTNSKISQQNIQLTALTVTTSVSFSAPVLVLHKKNSDLNKYDSEALTSQFDFTPTFSWGEYTGTIKVMRC